MVIACYRYPGQNAISILPRISSTHPPRLHNDKARAASRSLVAPIRLKYPPNAWILARSITIEYVCASICGSGSVSIAVELLPLSSTIRSGGSVYSLSFPCRAHVDFTLHALHILIGVVNPERGVPSIDLMDSREPVGSVLVHTKWSSCSLICGVPGSRANVLSGTHSCT
ncbi:hypothetical protein DL93DRAFT_749533 [Clavulina sp. PMI_390]|nr:hypothetical protein DL93DRAFT_749533 [Clavulina sp. PMI_390]